MLGFVQIAIYELVAKSRRVSKHDKTPFFVFIIIPPKKSDSKVKLEF